MGRKKGVNKLPWNNDAKSLGNGKKGVKDPSYNEGRRYLFD
jgi:hypothetical protein